MNPTQDPNQAFYDAQNARLSAGFSGAGQNLKGGIPTVPATVPTSAPKVSTPVVGSGTASSFINDKVVPTMNDANKAFYDKQNTELQLQQNKLNQPTEKVTPTTPLTPEQQIANTPDAGYQWVYDKATGARTQAPLGSALPSNYSTVDVNNAIPQETITSADGNLTFKKLSDGSFGQYDTRTGQYMGMSNQTQFDAMKTGQAAKTAYDNAVTNGAQLKPNQVAQINAISATYQRILEQQAKDNANFTGGTTVAQNLYGIGNTMMGMGNIKTTIDAGAAKIADINSKMNSDIAKMTLAFQSENLGELKDAYQSFVTNSSSLQKAIDTQNAEASMLERATQQQKATAEQQVDNDIRQLMTYARGVATPEQLQKAQIALQNHDIAGAQKALGDSTRERSPAGKEYDDYVAKANAAGIVPMGWNEYQTADANRKARIAAAGASIVGGTDMNTKQQAVFNTIVDKMNNSKPIQAQQRTDVLQNTINAVKSNPKDSANQLALIYGTIQILDSYQSAVREGEISLVQDTQGFKEKMNNLYDKVDNGSQLDQEAINRYVKLAQSMINTTRETAELQKNNYRAQAQINGIQKPFSEYESTITALNKDTIGQKHVQEAVNKKTSLLDWSKADPKNATTMNSLRIAFPKASPEEIYDKLKAKSYIK